MRGSLFVIAILVMAFNCAFACTKTDSFNPLATNLCPFQKCMLPEQCSSGKCLSVNIDDNHYGYCMLNIWIIVVIAMASVLLCIGLICLCVCCCRRRRRNIRHSLHTYHHYEGVKNHHWSHEKSGTSSLNKWLRCFNLPYYIF